MGWLEFWASIVNSVAWPLAALLLAGIIIVVFEEELADLIRRFRKAKHGNSSLEFSESVQTITEKVSDTVQPNETEPSPPIGIRERDRFTIRNDPRALAIEAWWSAESAARKWLSHHGVDDEIGPPAEVVRRLIREDLIDESASDILMRLLELRNMAVHAPRI